MDKNFLGVYFGMGKFAYCLERMDQIPGKFMKFLKNRVV